MIGVLQRVEMLIMSMAEHMEVLTVRECIPEGCPTCESPVRAADVGGLGWCVLCTKATCKYGTKTTTTWAGAWEEHRRLCAEAKAGWYMPAHDVEQVMEHYRTKRAKRVLDEPPPPTSVTRDMQP